MLKTFGLAWTQALVRDELFQVDLNGKVCLVTGATIGGIGYETAKKMFQLGCTVVLICRSEKNGKEAQELIKKESSETNTKGRIEYLLMDLSDLQSVSQLVQQFKKKFDRLDYLFNNAGVMGCPHDVTAQGVEVQFGTNHLGHFLLTVTLMELIQKVGGRIINVSSVGSKLFVRSEKDIEKFCSYSLESVSGDCKELESNTFKLYGRSKLANVLFTRKLAREFKSSNISSYAVHPGGVKTNLARYDYGIGMNLMTLVLKPLFKTPYEGAQTSLHVALAPTSELENGGYYQECEVDANSFADNIELQDRLWETSMTLVKEYL